jgi:hypothetical protein
LISRRIQHARILASGKEGLNDVWLIYWLFSFILS